MKQVIEVVDPEVQLKREHAYRARLDRDMKALEDDMSVMRTMLDKAANGLERSITSLREATLEIQDGDIVMEEACLVMQDGRSQLGKYMHLPQKLKDHPQEDKNHD
jgi:hypothetical protein